MSDKVSFFIIIPKKTKLKSIRDTFILKDENKTNRIFKVN